MSGGGGTWYGGGGCAWVGGVDAVGSVGGRPLNALLAFVTLTKATDASTMRLPNLNNLPTRKSTVVSVPMRLLPSGSRLIVWAAPNASARLIWRVNAGPCCERKFPLTITSWNGSRYILVSLN